MKRRVLRTYKILAVALTTSTAACAPSTGGTSGLAPQTAESVAVAATPSPAAPAANAASAAPEQPSTVAVSEEATAAAAALVAAVPAAAPAAPAPPAAPEISPAMYALREGLYAAGKGAFTQVARFKALCDSDGYPLVGNLVRGKGDPGVEPSSFCAEVRRTSGPRTAGR